MSSLPHEHRDCHIRPYASSLDPLSVTLSCVLSWFGIFFLSNSTKFLDFFCVFFLYNYSLLALVFKFFLDPFGCCVPTTVFTSCVKTPDFFTARCSSEFEIKVFL